MGSESGNAVDKDFVVEDGKVVAYFGSGNKNTLRIPDGATVIGANFLRDGVTVKKMIIPASVEIIEAGAFGQRLKCYEVEFEENSRLREIHDYPRHIAYFKAPKSVEVFSVDCIGIDGNSNTVLVLPSGCKLGYTRTAKHVFWGGKWNPADYGTTDCGFLYDEIDCDSVEFVDKLKTEGVAYVKTNKGTVITEVAGKDAGFTELPTEWDGIKATAVNLVPPVITTLNAPSHAYASAMNDTKIYDCVDNIMGVYNKAEWGYYGKMTKKLHFELEQQCKKLCRAVEPFEKAKSADEVLHEVKPQEGLEVIGSGKDRTFYRANDFESPEYKNYLKRKAKRDRFEARKKSKTDPNATSGFSGFLIASLAFGIMFLIMGLLMTVISGIGMSLWAKLLLWALGVIPTAFFIIYKVAESKSITALNEAIKSSHTPVPESELEHVFEVDPEKHGLPWGYKRIIVCALDWAIKAYGSAKSYYEFLEADTKRIEKQWQQATLDSLYGKTYEVKDENGKTIGTITKK